jgi:colanic acid biosynthesis glycosyl transferase WcaI
VRLLVHDYSGHPFQIQLSRKLAERGHTVLHLHCPSYRSGKGALTRSADDPDTFAVEGVALRRTFEKYSPLRRLAQEQMYGRLVERRVRKFEPDVVLSSNTPLFSQRILIDGCRKMGAKFVFWQQDIYSLGMRTAVAALPWLGRPIASAFSRLERTLLTRSDAVVAISEDFLHVLRGWGVATSRVSVIENWAPLCELPLRERENAWRSENGLTGKIVLLYSGTLGRKHDPNLLLQLAIEFRDQPDVAVVVVSEGVGTDWLRERVKARGLTNLELLPFQPYERLPEVLGTGDVLVAILESDAGVYAVPSKVLTYQCAGRAILASVPGENLAARIIERSGSGVVVPSGDVPAFLGAARKLVADGDLRETLGQYGRRHAVESFDIDKIAFRFEGLLEGVAKEESRGVAWAARTRRRRRVK